MADKTKLIEGIQWTGALGFLGLAHQVGYWAEFGVNVFAHASPANLIPLAIAPLVPKLLLILPTFLWMAVIASLITGGRKCYAITRGRETNWRRRIGVASVGYSLLTLAGIWAISLTQSRVLGEGAWGLDSTSGVTSLDDHVVAIIAGSVVPPTILIVIILVLFASNRNRLPSPAGRSGLVAVLFVGLLMYGAGRVEGAERKYAQWGSFVLGPTMNLPVLSFHYGYGNCLNYDSAEKLLGKDTFEILKAGDPPTAPMIRYVGRLSDSDFFFLPNFSELIVAKTDAVDSRTMVSCSMPKYSINIRAKYGVTQ